MVCARCSIPLLNGRCPKCRSEDAATRGTFRPVIPYQFSSRSESAEQASEWKQEILQKLERHKRKSTPSPSEKAAPRETAAEPVRRPLEVSESHEAGVNPGSAPASSAFHYRMSGRNSAPGEKILTYRPEGRVAAREKPVIRPVVKTGGKMALDKRQGRLRLDRSRVEKSRTHRSQPEQPERIEKTVFPEILLSRMLSGLIDVVTAVVAGGSTVLVASLATGAGVMSETLLRDTLMTAGVFFLFSSTFLLYLSGQTLGMLATELSLVAEAQKRPRLSDIVLRVLSFLAVMASLAGLLWALFDRRQLCWHDHLSKTRVVPR